MSRLFFSLALSALLPLGAVGAGLDVPRDTSFTRIGNYHHVLKKHPDFVLMPDTLPTGVREVLDVEYTAIKNSPYGDRKLHADIFRPDDGDVYPALIMIHGGGWNSGDKSLQRPMARQIAARGYVTIPVEYRLIPEALYPAGFHDIKTAVRWVRSNAASLGVDPDKIAVSGCSAGGQLAALTGVTNGSDRHEGDGEWNGVSSDVQAVVNMDGVCTFVSPHNIADADRRLLEKGTTTISAVWLGGTFSQVPDNWNEASAVNWISDKSAPMCFINSALPRFCDGRDDLMRSYKERNILAECHVMPVDVHTFWFFTPWAEQTIKYTVDFLDRIFKRN